MKTKLYVTDMNPNGTRTLIITDRDNQVIETIDEAIFGGTFNATDSTGGVIGLINGESTGYFEYSTECTEYDNGTGKEVLREESFVDMLLEYGECQGVELLFKISLTGVMSRIAISPVNDGSHVLKVLNKYFNLNKAV